MNKDLIKLLHDVYYPVLPSDHPSPDWYKNPQTDWQWERMKSDVVKGILENISHHMNGGLGGSCIVNALLVIALNNLDIEVEVRSK